MLLAACSAEPASEASPAPSARLELLLANPMANPELSFMELTSSEGSDNRADSGLVGGPTPPPPPRPSVYVTFDPVPAELVDQGLEELIEQAQAAGFEPGGNHFHDCWAVHVSFICVEVVNTPLFS